ncbi:MAG: pilQ [Myxococcaceae bacterium]|nr:pilQ [Myxococcaceae bacterium]
MFRLLADVGHVNIVVAGEVTGTVTLKLTHVPWDEALELIARLRGLDLERDGNVIMVRPKGAHASDDGHARAQSEFAAAPAISDP